MIIPLRDRPGVGVGLWKIQTAAEAEALKPYWLIDCNNVTCKFIGPNAYGVSTHEA